jgi:hypothetical protein
MVALIDAGISGVGGTGGMSSSTFLLLLCLDCNSLCLVDNGFCLGDGAFCFRGRDVFFSFLAGSNVLAETLSPLTTVSSPASY